MTKISRNNWLGFTTVAAAMLFAASTAPFPAHAQVQAQSKYASSGDTIVLLTGQRNAHLAIDGSTCTATSSGNSSASAIVIAVDGRCLCWTTSSAVPWPLNLKITADKVTFRDNGKSYVIRDTSAVANARELFGPVRAVIEKQADMGRKMSDLGANERATTRQFIPANISVPDMTAEFQKVEADAKRLSAQGGTQSELSELQSELSELQSRISELQSEASEEESHRSHQESELNSQMSAMSEELRARSAQMKVWSSEGEEATVQAARQIRLFLDQAVASGIAKPESGAGT